MTEGPSMEVGVRGGRIAFELGLGAALGAAAFLAPALLGLAGRDRGTLLMTASEGVGVPALAGLFVVGLLLGAVGTLTPLIHGMSTMAAMPVLVLVEVARDSSSHNLLPFEIAFYGLYAMIAVVGAVLARALVTRRRAGSGSPTPSQGGRPPGGPGP